ncbi:MAG: hypothetical protein ACKOZV_00685, partial [Bacteroidota bacterium]
YGLAMFGEPGEQTSGFADLNTQERIMLGAISLLVIILGFFPGFILNLTDSTVNRILGAVQL